jgi:hypothetical protein
MAAKAALKAHQATIKAADTEPTGCFAKPGHARGNHGVDGERQPEHHLLRADPGESKREARYEQKAERARSGRTPLPCDNGKRKRRHPCGDGHAARWYERDNGEERCQRDDDWCLTALCARARRRDDHLDLRKAGNAVTCRGSQERGTGIKSAWQRRHYSEAWSDESFTSPTIESAPMPRRHHPSRECAALCPQAALPP